MWPHTAADETVQNQKARGRLNNASRSAILSLIRVVKLRISVDQSVRLYVILVEYHGQKQQIQLILHPSEGANGSQNLTGYQLHYALGVFFKLLRPQFTDILLSDTPYFKHLTFLRTSFLSCILKIIKIHEEAWIPTRIPIIISCDFM